jgi:hypothetical protein
MTGAGLSVGQSGYGVGRYDYKRRDRNMIVVDSPCVCLTGVSVGCFEIGSIES